MSTPRNHHFVSQIHLKQFFNENEGCIFVYDKNLDNHYKKTTTKSLFSEKDLNTRNIDNEKDFNSLESDLNKYFEKDFQDNLIVLKRFITDLKLTSEVNNALNYFSKYGVIGDFRTPRHKQLMANEFKEAMLQIFGNNTSEFKEKIGDMLAYKKGGQFSNLIDYSELSDKILQLMGKLIFNVVIPKNQNDYFVLPDCSSVTERAKINTYFNPDIREIAYIGIPLTSKIYIHVFSEKIFKEKIHVPAITFANSNEVRRLNIISYNICESKIASKNQNYLVNFIKGIKTIA
ncbi:DUF4238 domain-containing protein [Robertkochia flava]|uniref:DUF4238 domain-containing protein n=1 Tax=Robertkochia flava TaxID=3447986 RepID=UPI001CCBADA7|nr:DUF4238 domain-containing protein [Robertkochia marina]